MEFVIGPSPRVCHECCIVCNHHTLSGCGVRSSYEGEPGPQSILFLFRGSKASLQGHQGTTKHRFFLGSTIERIHSSAWLSTRHQIRLHVAHIGHPVAGDNKYTCPRLGGLPQMPRASCWPVRLFACHGFEAWARSERTGAPPSCTGTALASGGRSDDRMKGPPFAGGKGRRATKTFCGRIRGTC